jgi:hypothetical protein
MKHPRELKLTISNPTSMDITISVDLVTRLGYDKHFHFWLRNNAPEMGYKTLITYRDQTNRITRKCVCRTSDDVLFATVEVLLKIKELGYVS